ncbi:MAG: hypothetical protein Tsb0013_15280 [Phycisphaerales bacterium]
MPDPRVAIPLAFIGSLGATLSGCVERVTGVRGGLYGIEGAQGGYTDLAQNTSTNMTVQEILESYRPADPTLTPIEGEPLRYLDASGDLHIECVSTRHLIYHITEMLRRGEHDLLFEWIVSDDAKRRYREDFRDPRETVDFLVEHEREIVDFFLLMPAGELTPGVRMTTPEPGVIRLRPELAQKYSNVRFTTLEVKLSRGRCTLLTIY